MIEIGLRRLPRPAEWSLAGCTVPRDRDNKGGKVACVLICLERMFGAVH